MDVLKCVGFGVPLQYVFRNGRVGEQLWSLLLHRLTSNNGSWAIAIPKQYFIVLYLKIIVVFRVPKLF